MTVQTSIARALLSVSDKRNLVNFAKSLIKLGVELVATGGTYSLLSQHNIPAIEISKYTNFPEILDGRVKTLHPKIHGGILYRRGKDEHTIQTHQIGAIDMVVVNLYPFQQTVAKKDASAAEIIENIDIGGPTMLRAAAKNFEHVTVVTDPNDYDTVIADLEKNHATSLATRRELAKKAFSHTAEYDTAIAQYFSSSSEATPPQAFPEKLVLQGQKIIDLRYGENPHQQAAYYRLSNAHENNLANAKLIQGKELSFNNLVDADAALTCAQALEVTTPACVIVKHATPCGVAYGENLVQAYQKAFRTDPVSAFGGIVAVNQELDYETTQIMLNEQFMEVLIAPAIAPKAQALLKNKPNLRVLICGKTTSAQSDMTLRSIQGGLLIQYSDPVSELGTDYNVVTSRKPTDQEWKDLHFAWTTVQFVKSNAIVYAKDGATLGIGTGQTSRVFSAQCAILKAEEANLNLNGAVMASDAFFPFKDSIELAAKAGITAVIQPGGSKRDPEVIAAANHAGLAMIFTGIRHFRH